MCVRPVRGAQGYAEDVERFFSEAARLPFDEVHRHVLHLIPTSPSKVLDVGAGSGRDAAALAAMKHHVVAVEPTAELRERAALTYHSPRIKWVDDSLPHLRSLATQAGCFDLIMLTAVWMHLDYEQRHLAMPRIASLVKPNGITIFSLRHGPVPSGRIMFDVSAEETKYLARKSGLRLVFDLEKQPSYGRGQENIAWTRLAFVK